MAEEEGGVNGDVAAHQNGGSKKYALVTDSFPNMIKCQDPVMKSEGAPNWRRLAGFPIYATGQPDLALLDKCVEEAVNKYDEQKAVLWVNLRQEPVIYVNGQPYSIRDPDNLHKHLLITEAFEINNIENEVAASLKKSGPNFSFYKDQVGEKGVENKPEYTEETGKLDSILTLGEMFSNAAKKEKKLESSRIPLNLHSPPADDTFDLLVRLLKGHTSAVPVVFNCQAGIIRSTTASVIAAMIKEAQLEGEFAKMRGIVPDNIIDGLRGQKLHPPVLESDQSNALIRGEFPVVMELIQKNPHAKECKDQVDRLISVAAACVNIRESAAYEKMQFDVASDDWRLALRDRIMEEISRYFMLIIFAIYCKEVGSSGFSQPFKKWLDNTEYREMIETGKSNIEWERKVPAEKIQDLKDLLNADNFDENLPTIINKINQLSYKMFNDLPRGDQKCKSMRKLAGRTLLEVLPPKLTVYLEGKLGSLANVPDFYDMVGQLSMYGKLNLEEK